MEEISSPDPERMDDTFREMIEAHSPDSGKVQADCPTLRTGGAGPGGGRCYSCGQMATSRLLAPSASVRTKSARPKSPAPLGKSAEHRYLHALVKAIMAKMKNVKLLWIEAIREGRAQCLSADIPTTLLDITTSLANGGAHFSVGNPGHLAVCIPALHRC